MLSLLPIVLIIASGCSKTESTPVDPGTFTGNNGFTINGGEFSNKVVTFSKAGAEYLDERGDQIAIRLEQATLGDDPITLVLALSGSTPVAKDYAWVDADDIGPNVAYLTIDGEEESLYLPKSGHTVITSVGPQGGNVVGTFSGTIENAAGTQTYTINGKFTAVRIN
jgi:hypothetical protein